MLTSEWFTDFKKHMENVQVLLNEQRSDINSQAMQEPGTAVKLWEYYSLKRCMQYPTTTCACSCKRGADILVAPGGVNGFSYFTSHELPIPCMT